MSSSETRHLIIEYLLYFDRFVLGLLEHCFYIAFTSFVETVFGPYISTEVNISLVETTYQLDDNLLSRMTSNWI